MNKGVLALVLICLPAAAQVGGRAARPKVQRPDGPVWNVIRKNCTDCHGIDDYAFYAMDKAGWQKLIADKHKGGEAKLSDADLNLLTDWMASKFGPDSKPFPRSYVPPEIKTFFSDPEAYRLMNRACTKCHGIDRAQNTRKAEEGWRPEHSQSRGGLARHARRYARTGSPVVRRRTGTPRGVAHPCLGNQSGQMNRCHVLISATLFGALLAQAETPKTAATGAIESYTATTANVSGAPDNIRINILRWSTDAERDKLMDAWSTKTAEPGRGGRGGAGRGGAARGGAGRGGRGGGEEQPAPKVLPETMLAKALKEATTVGYLWSREVAGYSIRYAGRSRNPDGSERIILLTDRRLGAVNDLWNPTGTEPPPYDFTLIELRLKANGEGEGKASLTGKVEPDGVLKIITLENYDSLPAVFAHVARHGADQK